MKIGVLTYHRSQNYGAQLQALALQEFLVFNGYDVSIIDYWPDYHKELYRPKFLCKDKLVGKSTISKLKYLLWAFPMTIAAHMRHFSTNHFVMKYLHTSNLEFYDVVIYGSDQIWRKQHAEGCESFNPVYFGDEAIQARTRIAYAASMGRIEVNSQEDFSFLNYYLALFSSISVREMDLHDFLISHFDYPVNLVCDPVFLLDRNQWSKYVKTIKRQPYILLYNIAKSPQTAKLASDLSKVYNLPAVEYCGYVEKMNFGNHKYSTRGAMSFLNALYNAEMVVTSSFHGVALSITLEKQFVFSCPSQLSNRVESLLAITGLESRNLSNHQNSDFIYLKDIDYNSVKEKVSAYSLQSRRWLMEELSMSL